MAVLMEQQKKMLSLIGSVANATTSLKAVSKFKKLAQDSSDDDEDGDDKASRGGGSGKHVAPE